MNRLMITIAIAELGLGVLILGLACGTGTQDANRSQNVANGSQTHSEAELASDDDACKATNPNNPSDPDFRAAAIQERIDKKIAGDKELEKMYHGDPQHDRAFQIQAKGYTDKYGEVYVVVYIEGVINQSPGALGLGKDKFDNLIGMLETLVKKECVRRVVFVPPGTLPITSHTDTPLTKTSDNPFFEWQYCEFPTHACSDGSCAETCPQGTPAPVNSPANSNANK